MIDITNYGYTQFFSKQIDMIDEKEREGIIPARVSEVHREIYKVVSQFGEISARLKGTLLNQVSVSEDFPAVGDFVMIKYNEQGDSVITKILDRKTKFSRPDYSGHNVRHVKSILEQVVAANFDYVFILVSLNFDLNINRIQRYITAAWQSGGTPVIVLTKADLVNDYSKQVEEIQLQTIGIDVVVVSAFTGMGIDKLDKYLEPASTLVFLGSSGVGKSSLVNALAGEEIMNVNTIREDDSKGRHTTTHRQLIMLKNGVMIIDTPGMRELSLWNISEGLEETFRDIEELILNCKFSNCTHKNEPQCAIIEALGNGTLDKTRWNNYNRLKKEAKFTNRIAVNNKAGNNPVNKKRISNSNNKKAQANKGFMKEERKTWK